MMTYMSLSVVVIDFWGTYAAKYFPALGSPLVLAAESIPEVPGASKAHLDVVNGPVP